MKVFKSRHLWASVTGLKTTDTPDKEGSKKSYQVINQVLTGESVTYTIPDVFSSSRS